MASRVHTLVEEQAGRTPDATAIVFENQNLAYRELNERADELADALRHLGVGPDVPVGICLERSVNMVVGALAIMKAGGAYLPIEPAHPPDRRKLMVENARVQVLLTQATLRTSLAAEFPELRFLCVDEPNARPSGEFLIPANGLGDAEHTKEHQSPLAYVIYTSGSTGIPKGVAIEHRNAVNFIRWAQQTFTREELAVVLFSSSLCFDLSIFELFVTLSVGGKVIIARNAIELPDLPAKNEITLINSVPSAVTELLRLNAIPPSVQVINLAGEPLNSTLVDRLYALGTITKVHDLYGPTETTTYSTYALRQAGAPATIGKAIANTQIHLLDETRRLVGKGEAGEIYIGGAGVARGYLHRADLTAERFVPDPFSSAPDARLYRTGDLARMRPDGNLEFIGRLDHQIKIRGYRIELGEIETVLAQHPAVRECVVIAREDALDKKLVAYLVQDPVPAIAPAEFRRFLQKRLPEYMIPSAFFPLEALPLTPNGKVDRKRLPALEGVRPELTENFMAPGTAAEKVITQVWSEVLGLDPIGINDDFFELGGDSLLSVRVVSRLRQAFDVQVPVLALFEAPTIAMLALGLGTGRWGRGKSPERPITRAPRNGKIPLSFSQRQLWFMDQLTPGTFVYNIPVAVRLEGHLVVDTLRECLNEIVLRHEILRTTFTVVDGEPEQTISPGATLELPLIDLSGQDAADREVETRRVIKTEAQRPFSLACGPLIRCTLLRLNEHEHVLVVVMHHIVSDGWSLDIFLGELARLWDGRTGGGGAPPGELPFQYADYAIWQHQLWPDEELKVHLSHWRRVLEGAPSSLKLPADGDGSKEIVTTGAQCTVILSRETTDSLRQLNRRAGSTSFMTLLSALMITLNRWTRQADIVVGTVSAGRTRPETEKLIGCFMNFLPIRSALTEGDTGLEILARVKGAVLDAHAHLDCPFEKIVEAFNPERGPVRNPIYNVGFLLENFPKSVLITQQVTGTLLAVDTNSALLDLRFIADESESGITMTCKHRMDLFESKTIEDLLASFAGVVEALVREPEGNLASFKITPGLLEQSEKSLAPLEEIVIAGTFTAEPLREPLKFWMDELGLPTQIQFAPYNQVFQQLLDPGSLLSRNQSGMNIVLVALEDWAPATETNDGAGLDFEVNIGRSVGDLISALRSASRQSAAPFLLCICPSSTVIARGPGAADFLRRMEQRIAAGLASCANVHLVFPEQLAGLYPVDLVYDPHSNELGHVPYTPAFFTALATKSARTFNSLRRPAPKVIVLDCDHTLWAGVCGEDGPDGIKLSAPYRALQEFMRAQMEAGRLLCLCSKNSPEDVRAVFERHKDMPLRWEHFAATRINWLAKSDNLKALAAELGLGAESFVLVDDNPLECAEVQANCPGALALQLPESPESIPQFLKHCWIFDARTVTAEDNQRAAFYGMERQRQQARADSPSLPDFLARLDLQVAITEALPKDLARVSQLTQRTNQFNCTTRRRTEAAIQALPPSRKILVVSVSDRFGDYGLAGLIICGFENGMLAVETFLLSCRVLGRGVEHKVLAHLGRLALDRGAARVDVQFVSSAKNQPALDFLGAVGGLFWQALDKGGLFRFPAEIAAQTVFNPAKVADVPLIQPSAARPADQPVDASLAGRWRWIALEASQIPDIQALIEAKAGVRRRPGVEPAAAGSNLERELCTIWQELLRMDCVGPRDNFFELGGHSLLAVRLFAQIEARLHIKLPILTIFQSPTVEQLAIAIGKQSLHPADASLLPIQPNGRRLPLFLVHGAGGDVLWGYANLAHHTSPDQPIYGIQASGTGDFATLEEMAARYVTKVRAFQPVGPYHLGGYCFGGNVAQEMARQLEADGERVALLALIDCASSNSGYEKLAWWRPTFVRDFTRNVFHWLNDFSHLKPEQRRSLVWRKVRTLPPKLWNLLSGRRSRTEPDLEEFIDVTHVSDRELHLWRNHLGLLARHVSKPYSGHLTLFRTRSHPLICSFANDFGWGKLAPDLTVRNIPGSHEGIFMEPHVRQLARELDDSQRMPDRQLPEEALTLRLV